MLSYAQSEDILSKLFADIENNYTNKQAGFVLTLGKYQITRKVLMRHTKTPHNEIQIISLCVNTLQMNTDRLHMQFNNSKDI